MLTCGVRTESSSLIAALKSCSRIKDQDEGTRLHHDILKGGLLHNNIHLGNTLVSMYSKCGALYKARQLLDELAARDVVSWSALIAGYAQAGQGEEALECFKHMQSEGLVPNAVTYTCILKACGTTGEADKGIQIHDKIVSQGLLGMDLVLGNALVDMYAKCGLLSKAQRVLDELPSRDIVSWSALIAGYTKQGQGEEALECLRGMESEGLSPDAITYGCILKACAITGAIDRGKQIHDEIVCQGLLQGNIVLGNALVDMYAKCGVLSRAQKVLEALPTRDVISWSALIGGYVQQGQGEEALFCLDQMRSEGISPNTITYISILKACGMTRAVCKGERLYDDITNEGLFGKDVELGNALVDMYVQFGMLRKARQLLDKLQVRDIVTWSSLIAGYAQRGQVENVLENFQRMQGDGLSPDAITYACILKTCGLTAAVDMGKQIHAEIVSKGLLGRDITLGNALIDMYGKCGVLTKAQEVLDELPIRNVVSWSTVIAGYAGKGHGNEAMECFDRMQREGIPPNAITYICILKTCGMAGDIERGEHVHGEIAGQGLLKMDPILGNAVVDMFAKCGALTKAQQVLEELSIRDVVSWSSLIVGYAKRGQCEEALQCFEQMQSEGLSPDAITYAGILKACGIIGAVDKGMEIHNQVRNQGLLGEDVLRKALVDMYARCGVLTEAHRVLEELGVRELASWSSLIAGHALRGQGKEAFECLEQMQREGLSPDTITYICLLKACCMAGATDRGEQIYKKIVDQGLLGKDVTLGNALVDMYAKCGMLPKAQQVLDKLPIRDIMSWSALIAGYAQQGQVKEALLCFQHTQSEGLSADAITYAFMLKACGIIFDRDTSHM